MPRKRRKIEQPAAEPTDVQRLADELTQRRPFVPRGGMDERLDESGADPYPTTGCPDDPPVTEL